MQGILRMSSSVPSLGCRARNLGYSMARGSRKLESSVFEGLLEFDVLAFVNSLTSKATSIPVLFITCFLSFLILLKQSLGSLIKRLEALRLRYWQMRPPILKSFAANPHPSSSVTLKPKHKKKRQPLLHPMDGIFFGSGIQ